MSEWSKDLVLEFLEAYKTQPVLWNPKHPHYRDKNVVKDAWNRVSSVIGVPVADIKKKKESLMAMFRTHLKKKRKVIESAPSIDELYKPSWFAFKTMEKFLGQVYDENLSTSKTEILGLSGGEENYSTDEATFSVPPTSTSPVQNDETRRRRSAHFPDLKEANNQMKLAFSLLSNVLSEKLNKKEDDECDLFGRLLAKKLKKLSDEEREETMYEIETLIINKKNPRMLDNEYSSPTSSHLSLEN